MASWKVFQWQFIYRLANSELSKVVSVVPVVGYLILFNDQFVSLSTYHFISESSNSAESPFFLEGVTKLRLTFFGSIFVLLGNLVARAFYPKLLDYSNGDIHFSDRVINSFSHFEIKTMEEEVVSDPKATIPALDSHTRSKPTLTVLYGECILKRFDHKREMLEEHEPYVRLIARCWWHRRMHDSPMARFTALFSSIIGFSMIAIPSADIAQAVAVDLVLG